MIIDLPRFIAGERPYWTALEKQLERLEEQPEWRMPLEEARRFHYLYERASSDLARLATFASEPELRTYLENLVARAYGEIHETRQRQRFAPLRWFFYTLPQAFRRHVRAFWLSLAVTLAGCAFGALALALDPEAKPILMPFSHLLGDPADRVAAEEKMQSDALSGQKSTFSGFLMTHNTQVAITTFALGMTYGIGTVVLLFYNGIILGAVAFDYIHAGHATFLLGWLMPHGVIEIPAILIGGQAGLLLAGTLIGRGSRQTLGQRLRVVREDLVTLLGGVALMLIWAGLVEAFLSQYHQPVIPYTVKIAFGTLELVVLVAFLARSGASVAPAEVDRTSA
jgi:uncharacterized membrane protein SpoIIM required for sporulation